jgi:hypothetical protein
LCCECLKNFEPLWRKTQIIDDTAKLIFYTAFIDGTLEAPRSLLPEVHRLYFEPQYQEFATDSSSTKGGHWLPIPQIQT